MLALTNELALLEKRLMELDKQLDSIDAAQKESTSAERFQLRRRLCDEHVQLDRLRQDLIATTPDVPEVKQYRQTDFHIRGRQQLAWREALQRALTECSRPLAIDEIAHAITQGAWMKETAAINAPTIRSAIDRYRSKLSIITLKGKNRQNRYWLVSRQLPESLT